MKVSKSRTFFPRIFMVTESTSWQNRSIAGRRASPSQRISAVHWDRRQHRRTSLSFFFFFCVRFSVQVQVKGYDSFEGLPRLCGRPRDCRHAGSNRPSSCPIDTLGTKISSCSTLHIKPIELKLSQISLQTPRRV